jgi:hypothetical protein
MYARSVGGEHARGDHGRGECADRVRLEVIASDRNSRQKHVWRAQIEGEIPAGKIIHVILDNYGSHKHPKVRAWLDRHPVSCSTTRQLRPNRDQNLSAEVRRLRTLGRGEVPRAGSTIADFRRDERAMKSGSRRQCAATGETRREQSLPWSRS